MTALKPISAADWLHTQTRPGARCGNCGNSFTCGGAGRFKGIAGVPNGAGYSIYALCRTCARKLKRKGPAAIPNAVRDAELAALLYFMPVRGHA